MIEEWKVIEGTKGNYSVSTLGRVRRNAGVNSIGRRIKETILKQSMGGRNRDLAQVSIHVDAKKRTLAIAKTVGLAFHGVNSAFTLHKDSNPQNNAVENIEANALRQGECTANAKLTEKEVREIRGTHDLSARKIAQKYGISHTQVLRIRARKLWTHVL